MAERLTARSPKNNMVYLAKVKDNEQDIEGAYDTLICIRESWEQLAAYEDLGSVEELADKERYSIELYNRAKKAESELKQLKQQIADGKLVEVVRCGECKYKNAPSCQCLKQTIGVSPIRYYTPDDVIYCGQGERREK